MNQEQIPLGEQSQRSPYKAPYELVPARSAHAYIDYLEGCLAQTREFIDAATQLQQLGLSRLATLEKAHADLLVAVSHRSSEFESRLDHATSEIKDFKTVALHLAERIAQAEARLSAIEHPTVATNSE